MDATTATDFITANKGTDILVVLTDSTTHYGEALSVNSKGVNIKVDGKTRSFSLKRVDVLELARDNDDRELTGDEIADLIEAGELDPMDDDITDEEIYAELGEAMTTAELAAHLAGHLKLTDFTAKALRVHLRSLGLGVGKGRKYSLSATEFRMVRDLVKADANAN